MSTHRGKRAGRRHKPLTQWEKDAKADARSMVSTSSPTAVAIEGKRSYTPAMFEFFGAVETEETHVIPRESLTKSQGLPWRDRQVETETMRGRQLDTKHYKRTGQIRMIEVTDERVTWRSDRNLLRRDRPLDFSEKSPFKRLTSKSKRILPDQEPEIVSYENIDGEIKRVVPTKIEPDPTPDVDLD